MKTSAVEVAEAVTEQVADKIKPEKQKKALDKDLTVDGNTAVCWENPQIDATASDMGWSRLQCVK